MKKGLFLVKPMLSFSRIDKKTGQDKSIHESGSLLELIDGEEKLLPHTIERITDKEFKVLEQIQERRNGFDRMEKLVAMRTNRGEIEQDSGSEGVQEDKTSKTRQKAGK